MSPQKRVVSIQLSHETNTFSTTLTDMAAFKRRIFVEDGDVRTRFTGTRTELGAHIDYAGQNGWDLIQPFAAHATPSGLVAKEMLEYCIDKLCAAAKDADGAVLALHGAMVAQHASDAEGYLLAKLRQVMGVNKPIVITLDTHANVTDAMADAVNGIYIYRTYPHVDQYEVATEACQLVSCLFDASQQSKTFVFRLPMLDGCDHGRTHGNGPMPALLAQAAELKAANEHVQALEISVGFPWSDIHEAGPAVSITTTQNRDWAKNLVTPLMLDMWRTRNQRSIELKSLDEIVGDIGRTPVSCKPIVIADFSDNPGHGAPGDGVALIKALHSAGIQNVAAASVCDPEAVDLCWQAGVGARLSLSFGAKAMPEIYGPPLTVECEVVHLGDGWLVYEGPMRRGTRLSLGRTATITFGSVHVVLATNNIQTQDLAFFRANAIDPMEMSVLVVKSQQHFRAAFEPIASKVLLADSGGFVSPDLTKLNYHSVRRPVWPLDRFSDSFPGFQ